MTDEIDVAEFNEIAVFAARKATEVLRLELEHDLTLTRHQEHLEEIEAVAALKIDRLRASLISIGRHFGAFLADKVSDDFLMGVADEVNAAYSSVLQQLADVRSELGRLKLERMIDPPPPVPAAEEPRETWFGLDSEGRILTRADGTWDAIRFELIFWLSRGWRPVREKQDGN